MTKKLSGGAPTPLGGLQEMYWGEGEKKKIPGPGTAIPEKRKYTIKEHAKTSKKRASRVNANQCSI